MGRLERAREQISWQGFSVEDYSLVLDGMLARGERVYSALTSFCLLHLGQLESIETTCCLSST
jgi:hypothetical protein